jgi:ethanolamine utilization protein EutQ (cupin superfamily)
MQQPIEVSVELTAQELIDSPTSLVGSHDLCELTTIETCGTAVNAAPAMADSDFDIELTADEIDALLEGRLPVR